MGAPVIEVCDGSSVGLLAEVGERTFRETYEADTSPEDMERHVAEVYNPATIERELDEPGSTFFVALVDGAVAGYMKLNRAGAQTELREERGFEIESLYVLREHQGRRVGQALLDRALDEAREAGAEYVWLGVWERNVRARSFWERQGFVEFDTHPFPFGGTEHNDLMMRRSLAAD